MIDLTPLEVRKKKGDFRRTMRGYDAQSVDDFLDLVADRLEQLVRENATFTERVSNIESQVADYRERERALTEALVTAQEMREQMRKQMEREVELKLREAEADAEAVRSDVMQMREREEESIRRLRARQAQFIQSYRSFLEREIAELSVMTETLDLDAAQGDEPPRRKRSRRAEASAPDLAPLPPPTPVPVRAPEPPRVPESARAPEPEPESEDFRAPAEAPAAVARPQAATPPASAPDLSPGPDLFEEPLPFDEPLPFEREPVEPDALSLSDEPFGHEAPPAARAPAQDHDLIDLSKMFPAAEPEEEDVPELELIDEVEEDEPKPKDDKNDNDGWVSTLLEGKGD